MNNSNAARECSTHGLKLRIKSLFHHHFTIILVYFLINGYSTKKAEAALQLLLFYAPTTKTSGHYCDDKIIRI